MNKLKVKIKFFDNKDTGKNYFYADALPDNKTALIIFSTLVIGLLIDQLIPLWGQVIAGVMAWGLLGMIYWSRPRAVQNLLMSCLVMATFGEIFCSLIWQLYDYRLFNIPPYVPPGHVLVFLLGSYISERVPKIVGWVVPALVAPYVVMGFWLGFDEFGVILFSMLLAFLIAEKNRTLYSTMFMLCLVLEIYGTMLGNWTWRPQVPVWGLNDTNPPLAAGAFYCALDFLMFRVALAFWSGRILYGKSIFWFQQRAASFMQMFTGYAPQAELAAENLEESRASNSISRSD